MEKSVDDAALAAFAEMVVVFVSAAGVVAQRSAAWLQQLKYPNVFPQHTLSCLLVSISATN